MTNCECPIAGYCQRHGITKSEHWHKLCQRDDYFTAWEAGRGPGQTPPAEATDARRERVARNVAARRRLIGWLRLLRAPQDRGIGDTAHRLYTSAKPRHEVRNQLDQLLNKCSCSRVDAVSRLNREYPD